MTKGEDDNKSWGSRRNGGATTTTVYHTRALENRLGCAATRSNVQFLQTHVVGRVGTSCSSSTRLVCKPHARALRPITPQHDGIIPSPHPTQSQEEIIGKPTREFEIGGLKPSSSESYDLRTRQSWREIRYAGWIRASRVFLMMSFGIPRISRVIE